MKLLNDLFMSPEWQLIAYSSYDAGSKFQKLLQEEAGLAQPVLNIYGRSV